MMACGEPTVAMARASSRGHPVPFIAESSRTIAAMEMVRSSIRTALATRASGGTIRRRGKVNSVFPVALSIAAASATTRCMGKVHLLGRAMLITLASGAIIRRTAAAR